MTSHLTIFTLSSGLLGAMLVAGVASTRTVREATTAAQAQMPPEAMPRFEIDPYWPKALPNNWTFGEFSGVHVDSHDHIWVNQRPKTLANDEKYLTVAPPAADCCAPAPSIMEFDMAGNFIQGWGGPGTGYDWPQNEHGILVDQNDNVWLGGNGATDHHVLKFTKGGKFLMQIGRPGRSTGSDDPANLNKPAQIFVDSKSNEAFVADGYGNRRVVVFDAATGKYKRHWGAYGNKPDDQAPNKPIRDGEPARHFNIVHGVRVSKDGLVYVSDRLNNRIQVFKTDGTFVKEGFVARKTGALGVVYELEFSSDPQQRFIYVPDGSNNHIWILDRNTLQVLGQFGRQGRYAGQFHHSHSIAVDSQGNIYVAETQGKRVQRFLFKGMTQKSS